MTGRARRLAGVALAGLCASALSVAALAGILAASDRAGVPSFDAVRAAWRPSETRLLDRHGEVIHETRTDPRGRRFGWVPVAGVSPALVAAVVASEDRRFHRHGGADALALAAAAASRLTGAPPRGGSTITMQVAAALDPALRRAGGPRTLAQKWRQVRGAWALEARWSKAEILEAYLNLAAFRGEVQGVGAAAAVLFDRAAHGLDGGQAVVLAALLRAPNAPADAVARRAARLARVAGVAPDEAAAASARLAAAEPGAGPRVALAPHAAARLLSASTAGGIDVHPRAGARGGSQPRREAIGDAGGAPAVPDPPAAGAAMAEIRTTLDAAVQRIAIDALARQLASVRGRHAQDGAVLVADLATGEVLAYVGSGGAQSSARWVDGVQARRQAGSTLKPFLYAAALDERLLTPASLLDDSPLEIAVAGGGLYRPQNYDEQFRGAVSLRTALASSLNVPAVRTLGLVGEDAFVTRLRRLGFEGLRESGEHYGPALALGSGDVSLWELVGAYRALARGGAWAPLRLAADAAAGEDGPSPVYTPAAAFVVADILADREARSATFGLESPLATRFWTAVKTGTSRDMRDNWCAGFSRRFVVGVWVGNFSGEPMWNVSGVTGAAPAWLDVMSRLHARVPSEPPEMPAGVVRGRVRFARDVEPARPELFLWGTAPATLAVVPALARARIAAPTSGTIVAIDPGIPAARQRILLEARPGPEAVRFVLDGVDVGPAAAPVLWAPRPGRHRLVLMDADRSVHDAVDFEVRGPRRPPE